MSASADLSLLASAESPASGQSQTLDFSPPPPDSLDEAGLTSELIEQILTKMLFQHGEMSGWDLSLAIGLRFSLIEGALDTLKRKHLALVKRSLGLAGVTAVFALSDEGRAQAREFMELTQYMGAAPVPIEQYVEQVRRQRVPEGWLTPVKLANAYRHMVVTPQVLAQIGPAISAGKSMLIYGQPGNGKTYLAEALMNLDDTPIYIPHSVLCRGNIIRVFDPVQHHAIEDDTTATLFSANSTYDRRWLKCRRPFLISGGELTLSQLDLSFNEISRVYDAPFQMKANNGMYLIDDFGRQTVSTADILNRWIVPMERRIDYLTFVSGSKMEVPFETFVIFSSNLKPEQLGDEAFLRRIQYKMLLRSPDTPEYREIFVKFCDAKSLPFDAADLDRFIERHYTATGRPYRRCHPRDVVSHAIDMIHFESLEYRLTADLLDRAWESCFTQEVE
jgi:predicted ATPase with chaperone activity